MRVLVNGAYGRMGRLVIEALDKQKVLTLVGKAGRNDNLAKCISDTQAEIVIDFTTPDSAFDNTKTILLAGARPVIGTTGLSMQKVAELQALAESCQLSGAIIPNFSLGAFVLNKLAEKAAHYFNHIEIVEMHHELKRDAPSGTAMQTAQKLAQARASAPAKHDETEVLSGARGGEIDAIHIHALRLPGIMAKQTVYFGSPGETISIEHQVINREAYMPGLLMVCERVTTLTSLVYGLDSFLDVR